MTRPAPDVPVAAIVRHRVLISPHDGKWLVWCNCNYVEVTRSWDSAMAQRKMHQATSPLVAD